MNGTLPRPRTAEEMKFAKQISDWIRRVRVDGGFAYGKLASVAGVIPSTLRRWEDGESMPNPYQLWLLRRFARLHGLETPEL